MTRHCTIHHPSAAIIIGDACPLAVIAGPCTLESYDLAVTVGTTVRDACARLGLPYIFKASFDKANRSSITSARGPGLEEGLATLARVKATLGVPVTTDIHAPEHAAPAAEVVDVLQIPAFLCRQTDLLVAAGRAAASRGRAVNVKKGQFLSPAEMIGPVQKLAQAGCTNVMLTERGTFFGYGRLVNDFIGIGDMMELEVTGGAPPVCFDATHSAQLPGAGAGVGGAVTAGRRERVPMLARAAVAAGVHAVFLECHPDPDRAASDAATMLALRDVPGLLESLARIRGATMPP
ncbi:MAG: 3-deoxy-8-phosphooctulonate synthase [Phycisphaerales bacterium]